jgi:ferrous iron transport protein B
MNKQFWTNLRFTRHKNKLRDRLCNERATFGESTRKIVLVGNPNVGKSVVFNRLTGHYVTISNYPGTTVDVSRGRAHLNGHLFEIIDTPGMYSLNSITEEERVSKRILFREKPDVVVHVVDLKNLERMLPLTLQLIETGLPLVLQLNMIDEAESSGIEVNTDILSKRLGIPVVSTAAISGRGMNDLQRVLIGFIYKPPDSLFKYDDTIEKAIADIGEKLKGHYGLPNRAISLLLLQEDPEMLDEVKEKDNPSFKHVLKVIKNAQEVYSQPLSYILAVGLQSKVKRLIEGVRVSGNIKSYSFTESLSRLMMNPFSGVVILSAVVYFGLYQFVGVFGAGTLVDFIEGTVFSRWINPWATNLFETIIPWPVLSDLFVGEYGIFTLGLTYTFAIILPIVATFFIAFSVIEDSGYMPRLAMLIDRVFKLIGLNGRAVIPMVLGFGCDTMATIVTRTQETRRERIITTLLLALAIPCSAQLGVIFGILSTTAGSLFIWMGIILSVFVLVGFLASRLIPGLPASFYMEVPPLRLPKLSNVLTKTYARLEWYFLEIMPIFIIVSVVLWFGDITGAFDVIINLVRPLIETIGVPGDAAVAYIYGFFRRDFGAAGLYDLYSSGILTGIPLIVSAVVITLFVPCIAQFTVMGRERGWKTAFAIAAFILPFSFLIGWLVNLALNAFKVNL